LVCVGSANDPNCTSGFRPSYDGNGNVTNDNFHTYTWDADGHAATVDASQSDAVSLTYDALGRMVEQTRGSAHTQIVYSPVGQKLALMNGSTLQIGLVPLGNTALAAYNSGGLLYFRDSPASMSTRPGRTSECAGKGQTPWSPSCRHGCGEDRPPALAGAMLGENRKGARDWRRGNGVPIGAFVRQKPIGSESREMLCGN
jgi:YD repeat-containing protein